MRAFWWDDDRSFRLYLKAAKGDSVVQEIKDPETGKVVERRTPSVVISERPPSLKEAKANWRKASERLITLKREVDADLGAVEAIRQSCLQLADAKRAVAKGEAELVQLTARQPQLESGTARCQREHDAVVREHSLRLAKMEQHRRDRPGLFARLFRTERWKAWSGANAPLLATAEETTRILRHAEKTLSEAKAAQDTLLSQIRKAEVLLSAPRRRVVQLSSDIATHRQMLGDRLVDEAFFACGHELSNMAAPWIPDSLHRKREELFIAAMAVHRAFIDAAAQKVMHNLGALMEVFSGGAPKDEAKRRLLSDLWSTLFLVVPVISTTFA